MKKICLPLVISIILIMNIIGHPLQATPSLNHTNTIIIVDDEGDGDTTSIQAALNQAQAGDIINVYSGTYQETIIIETDDITLEGINHELGTGTGSDYPHIMGSATGNVVTINAQKISMTGFIIQGSGNDFFDAGISLKNDNNHINMNGLTGNFYGIVLSDCNQNTVQGNYILGNQMDGIYASNTHENLISKNVIKENGYQGMFFEDTTMNTISENTISLNDRTGIQFRENCKYNTIEKNTIHTNGFDGIAFVLDRISHNTLSKNTIYSNGWNGISLVFSDDNDLIENEITLNLINGIQLLDGDDNTISKNTISENNEEGIMIIGYDSNNNKIYYNNIINDNAFDNGNNQWDNGELGGNYWSYYSGTDADDDGIGDDPYFIPGDDNSDRYPLMHRLYPPAIPQSPSGPTLGVVGNTYQYQTKTTSTNKVQYGWDFNNDFCVDEWTRFYQSGQVCTINHSWEGNGTFHIRVKAMDNFGFQSEWSQPLTVTMPKQMRLFSTIMYHHPFIVRILSFFFSYFNSLIH